MNGRHRLSMRARWTWSLVAAAMHPILLYGLFPHFGEAANMVVFAAPIVAAMLLGWGGALLFGGINVLSTALMFRWVWGMSTDAGRPRALISIIVIAGVSYAADKLRRFIDSRKAIEEELTQAKKMEAVGRLAGGVAHDINNTLNAIMGSVYAHRKELEHLGRSFKDLDDIAVACERGAQLTRNLLGFARKSDFKKQVFSLNKVADSVHAILARAARKDIVIEKRLSEREPYIEGDRAQIENAVLNLCLNGLDAMEGGGTLTLSTAIKNGRVSISVTDTGTGMDAGVQEQAFEPFFTTKAEGKGTGLGLSMVYGVVHALKGRIRLQSAPGEGTRVTLTFPVVSGRKKDADVSFGASDSPSASGFPSGKTVLIIDDEPLVLRSAVRMFQAMGCAVISAGSGREGISLFEKHCTEVDFVVADLIMPELGGIDTLREIYEMSNDVPAVLVSGYTRESENMEAFKAAHPSVRFLPKPYRPAQMVAALEELSGNERASVNSPADAHSA